MKRLARFEWYQSKRNKNWYGRLRASNGEIVAVSEGYKTKAGVIAWRKRLVTWVIQADMNPFTTGV